MIVRWFYYPSLAFLLLALLSGTWLRLQWGWPQWQIMGVELPWTLFFRSEFLLHGHSHVALLGWTFLALAGLVLEAGTRRAQLPVRTLKVLAALTIMVTLVLFAAFVRDGYAPLSIALSTMHMLLGYVLAWIFFRHARSDSNIGSRYFLEGAVFWMVMATAGPWLLAAGRGLPPFWMDAAVHYYLHVLFNGWLLFGLAGLAWRYVVHPRYRQMVWPFWLMMAGLLPALLPRLGPGAAEMLNLPDLIVTTAGVAGSVLFATGGMAVVYYSIASKRDRKSESGAGKILLWVGLGGSLPVLLLPVFMSWPPLRDLWAQSDFMTVGFIHLHLLVVVTTLLVYAILQRLISGFNGGTDSSGTDAYGRINGARRPLTSLFMTGIFPPAAEIRARRFRHLLRWGILFFAAGSLAMVFLLILTGLFQLSGSLPPYPVQKTLFHAGLLALLGAMLLTAVLALRPLKKSRK